MPLLTHHLHDNEVSRAGTMVGPTVHESADARQLINRLQLSDLVETAIQLVRQYLEAADIHLESATDPDGENDWLVVRADVHGTVHEVLDRYAACKTEWVRMTPPTKLGFVRFAYNIL